MERSKQVGSVDISRIGTDGNAVHFPSTEALLSTHAHPSATIGTEEVGSAEDSVNVGTNLVAEEGARVHAGATIENDVSLGIDTEVGHEAKVGKPDYPVEVKEWAQVGRNATVRDDVGRWAIVEPHSFIDRGMDVPESANRYIKDPVTDEILRRRAHPDDKIGEDPRRRANRIRAQSRATQEQR